MKTFVAIFLLYSAMLPTYGANGQQVTLSPSDVTVEQGQYAEFICNYSCTIHNTYTVLWSVGSLPGLKRALGYARTDDFFEQTGMYVEVNRVHSCEHGRNEDIVIETLRINGSSANEFNKTAVQCFAFAKTGGQTESIYSRFGIMLINVNASKSDVPPTLQCPTSTHAAQDSLDHTDSKIIPDATQTQTVYVTSYLPTKTIPDITHTKTVYVTSSSKTTALPEATQCPSPTPVPCITLALSTSTPTSSTSVHLIVLLSSAVLVFLTFSTN